MNILRLFRLLNLHFLVRRKTQSILAIVGIAVGVGVVVSIRLANSATLESFRNSVDVVSGKATHTITAADGGMVPETDFAVISASPAVVAAAPVIEEWISVEEAKGEMLQVLGVEPFFDRDFRSYSPRGQRIASDFAQFLTDPSRIIVSASFMNRHSLKVGQSIHAIVGTRRISLTVHDSFESDDLGAGAENLAVMDIAAAQETFHRVGSIDRVDLMLQDDNVQELQSTLPGNLHLNRSETRTKRIEDMVRSFRMNLTALAMLAIFVATFLIYNTITFSVIQRRKHIGVLRCLGLTGRQIVVLYLGEAFLLGVLGGALGLVFGTALTYYTIPAVTQTVSELYVRINQHVRQLSGWDYALSLMLGVVCSMAASLIPSLEASHVRPSAALSRPEVDIRVRNRAGTIALAGLVILVIAGLLTIIPTRSVNPGYASAFLLLLGFGCLTPFAAALLIRTATMRTWRGRMVVGMLGLRNILASLGRTAPALSALMVSLAMMIGVSLMVQSFRETLIRWVDQTFRADIYIQPAGRKAQGNEAFLEPEFLESLRRNPSVQDVDLLRQRRVEVGGTSANLSAIRFDLSQPRARYKFLAGKPDSVYNDLRTSDTVIISETLRSSAGLDANDMLELMTPSGAHAFRVTGVYRDYSADGGQILMNYKTYVNHWNDTAVNNAALYLNSGADTEVTLRELRAAVAGRFNLVMRSNAALRTEILRVFDNTFAITYVMQFLTMVVAMGGILSALLALILERTRELGTLRSLGMTRSQLTGILFSESCGMAVVATIVGAVAGVVLGALLVYVINVRSFGWTIEYGLYSNVFFHSGIVALISATLATIYPALRLQRLPLAAAMREE